MLSLAQGGLRLAHDAHPLADGVGRRPHPTAGRGACQRGACAATIGWWEAPDNPIWPRERRLRSGHNVAMREFALEHEALKRHEGKNPQRACQLIPASRSGIRPRTSAFCGGTI